MTRRLSPGKQQTVIQGEGVVDRQRSGAPVTGHKEHRRAFGSGVRTMIQTEQHQLSRVYVLGIMDMFFNE